MTTQITIDETKLQMFMGRVIGDLSATWTSQMVYLGDRLDLFKALASSPSSPS